MPEVDLGDVTIAYDLVGEGEPVVLVAGLGQPAIAWHLELVPALVGAGYQVLTFDNRGVAPSSAPPSPYSIGQMVADTIGLLDRLGFDEPVRMAGHSMGGWIAETLAIEHPDRLRAAALMGSANTPTAWEKAITTVERDMARLDYDLPPLFYATETMRYLPLKELQRDEVVNGWLGMMEGAEQWQNPGRLGQYEAALEWSTDPNRRSNWAAIEIPCLVVAFEHDIDSPPDRAHQAAQLMPKGSYCEIADAGHIGILTHASLVAAELIEFFAQT
jgi:pimeloyl-ACP methyl ester carboxylesterase